MGKCILRRGKMFMMKATFLTLVCVIIYQLTVRKYLRKSKSIKPSLDGYVYQTRTDQTRLGTSSTSEYPLLEENSERGYKLPRRDARHKVDCQFLLTNTSEMTQTYANMTLDEVSDTYEDKRLIGVTRGCTEYKRARGYILHHLTPEEKNFAIAYSISMYKDPGQVERLLRAIYRPQNVYCIHVDKKSTHLVHSSMKALVKCFNNVFLSSKQVDVIWGRMSVLESQLICLRDLYSRSNTWKYYINLTGQDYPLKTNNEIVRFLEHLNGTNDVQLRQRPRYEFRWQKAGPPPDGIRPKKGETHVAITRAFANFSIHDGRAKRFLSWLNKTNIPDETFFNTLHYNPQLQAPGAYKGNEKSDINLLSKIINRSSAQWKCHGKSVRGVCIVGVGDLPKLTVRNELFVNKLYWNYQPLTMECLDEWLYKKTMLEYSKYHNN